MTQFLLLSSYKDTCDYVGPTKIISSSQGHLISKLNSPLPYYLTYPQISRIKTFLGTIILPTIPSTHLYIHPSIHSLVHLCVQPSIHQFDSSFIYISIIYPSIQLFIYLSIHPTNHSFYAKRLEASGSSP